MIPKLPQVLVFLLAITFLACSSDDDTNSNTDENTNQFIFNGETYNLTTAVINDEDTSSDNVSEISISIFNKSAAELAGNSDLTDINFVYFDFDDVTIQNTTYDEIDDYAVSTNSSIIDSEFNNGTVLLSDNDSESDVYAQSGSVTITNFTEFNIKLTFTFTRNDGQVISGSYDGNYILPVID
ncbi:hypothetical protein [Winogradskyella sp.]|uniref:hypothetical protein n=1 Tax=Winogradskyella sp. TaxID=1883156 RepID=UPI00263234A0|nr:hypothetical protein [Winogradskyella sp.]